MMYLLMLDKDFLLIDADMWKRVSTFDAVSRGVLAPITARELTEEQLALLVELELFQVSADISSLIDGVNAEIAARLNSAIGRLTSFVSAKINRPKVDALLAEYNRLSEKFVGIAHEAMQRKRDKQLQAELVRIQAEMDGIFAEIAALLRESYQALGIAISDGDIEAMVGGSKDDLLARYTEGLK